MKRPLVVSMLLLTIGCGTEAPPERPGTPPGTVAPPTATPDWTALQPDAPLSLTPQSQDEWRVEQLRGAPAYFMAEGWPQADTLFGLERGRPTFLPVPGPGRRAGGRPSWSVVLTADHRLAGLDQAGLWVEGGGETRLLLPRQQGHPAGEGDLSGPLHGSPDGSWILASWVREAPRLHALVNTATGDLIGVPERVDDLWLGDPFGWIANDQLLFTAHPSFHPEQGPLGRGDLVVFSLADRSLRRVTAVADGIFLRPVSAWGPGAILVAETSPPSRRVSHFRVFNTRTWSSTGIEIPPADRVIAHDPTRALLVVSEPSDEGTVHRVWLWQDGRGTRPLLQLRGQDPRLFWAPDGRRVAVSLSWDQPLEEMHDSFQTRYGTWILEPTP